MEPKEGAKHTLIWIPGFFDTSDMYLPLLQKTGLVDESTRVFSFQCPKQKQYFLRDEKEHTGFYQVYRVDKKAIWINKSHFDETVDYVTERMEREVERWKGKSERVTIAGFSQGGVLANCAWLKAPLNLKGGFLNFSGYIPYDKEQFEELESSISPEVRQEKRKSKRTLITHGLDDDFVDF